MLVLGRGRRRGRGAPWPPTGRPTRSRDGPRQGHTPPAYGRRPLRPGTIANGPERHTSEDPSLCERAGNSDTYARHVRAAAGAQGSRWLRRSRRNDHQPVRRPDDATYIQHHLVSRIGTELSHEMISELPTTPSRSIPMKQDQHRHTQGGANTDSSDRLKLPTTKQTVTVLLHATLGATRARGVPRQSQF
jgi:hypothetical protein